MKYLVFFLSFFCIGTGQAQDMDTYLWKNRLILVVSPTMKTEKVRSQMELLAKNDEGMKERDIAIIPLSPDAKALDRYNLPKNFEGILLIGKDGGLKFKGGFITKPSTLFTLIDVMPMRKAEMRKKDY